MNLRHFLDFLRSGPRIQRGDRRSTGEEPILDEGCALGAHRRLLDAHRLWHQAAVGYEDRAAFRTNLNACIEQLRSVTLVLQAEQKRITDFTKWYEPWRERLKRDPVSTWLNAARVQVFHVADLAAHSTARISLLMSPAGPKQAAEFDLPPDVQLADVVHEIRRRLPDLKIPYGVAIVERRWVANDLPDHELLDALAICYRQLDELVADAHAHLAASPHKVMPSRPECLSRASDARTSRIDLATAATMTYESYEIALTPAMHRRAIQRYGLREGAAHTPESMTTPARQAELFSELAKKVLARDGHHVPTLILLLPGGGSLVQQMVFTDTSDKLLHWQRVAVEVERVGARGLIFIGEAWVRSSIDGPIVGEVLNITLAEDNGTVVTRSTPFTHRFGRIRLAPTRLFDDERALYLEPVFKVWQAKKAK